jgi:hypothetical protein
MVISDLHLGLNKAIEAGWWDRPASGHERITHSAHSCATAPSQN